VVPTAIHSARVPPIVPYAVLVAALGAIVSTAIALFGLHTWSAIKVAPAVGAILGLALGALTLRLRGLALSAGMDEYKAAGRGGSFEPGAPLYAKGALNVAVVISIIEAPILFIDKTSAPIVFPAGWLVIAVWFFYAVWRLNAEKPLNNDLDVFKLVAGPFLVFIVGVAMYFAYTFLFSPAAEDVLSLIKAEFIINPFVGFGVAAIAILGIGAVSFFSELINPDINLRG
jgi:hypothetical protein